MRKTLANQPRSYGPMHHQHIPSFGGGTTHADSNMVHPGSYGKGNSCQNFYPSVYQSIPDLKQQVHVDHPIHSSAVVQKTQK